MKRWCFWLFPITVFLIAAIDYLMGEAASTLNGYEIIRRSLPAGISEYLPSVTPVYIIGQEFMGDWSLPWAWLLFMLWASLWSVVLCLVIRAISRTRA
jgi:hypothetical protein